MVTCMTAASLRRVTPNSPCRFSVYQSNHTVFSHFSGGHEKIRHCPTFISLKRLGHENRRTLFSHSGNIMQDTNGKSIYEGQNIWVSSKFKAIQDDREGCNVRNM